MHETLILSGNWPACRALPAHHALFSTRTQRTPSSSQAIWSRCRLCVTPFPMVRRCAPLKHAGHAVEVVVAVATPPAPPLTDQHHIVQALADFATEQRVCTRDSFATILSTPNERCEVRVVLLLDGPSSAPPPSSAIDAALLAQRCTLAALDFVHGLILATGAPRRLRLLAYASTMPRDGAWIPDQRVFALTPRDAQPLATPCNVRTNGHRVPGFVQRSRLRRLRPVPRRRRHAHALGRHAERWCALAVRVPSRARW